MLLLPKTLRLLEISADSFRSKVIEPGTVALIHIMHVKLNQVVVKSATALLLWKGSVLTWIQVKNTSTVTVETYIAF